MTLRKSRKRRGSALWFSLAVALLTSRLVLAADLQVKVFDVGQADAILVTCPDGDHHLLIDSGDTRYPGSSKGFRDRMLKLFPEGERKLEVVVASHPHQDHIGSMSWVLENFDVDTYVDNGQKFDTASYGKLQKLKQRLVKTGKITYINGKENSQEKVDFCPKVEMRLIEAWALGSLDDTNDRSVGVWLRYGDTKFLFVGDMEAPAEKLLLDNLNDADRKLLLDVDVLKVGHHGSDTSSTERFVRVVSPEQAVISAGEKDVGTNARYKHPRRTTIDTFNEIAFNGADENGRVWAYDKDKEAWRQVPRRQGLWATPKDGTVTVVSDGQNPLCQHD
jgi:competence protein ComEC